MTDRHAALNPVRRRVWLRVATGVIAGALVLYALSAPILAALGRQLIHADALQRADAIVVLAPLWERAVEAADVYRQGYAPLVVITRASRDSGEQELLDRRMIESSEDRKRNALVALGVPHEAVVILDPLVDSTVDEARAFAEWAARHPVRRVIVVTSPLHTARSRLTFIRALENLPVEVLMRPASRNAFRSDTWWRSRNTFREGLIELQKLVYYRLIELPRLTPAPPRSAHPS
jgi:uncharacterized SAM-binding protein YcdF (DUF218 family)